MHATCFSPSSHPRLPPLLLSAPPLPFQKDMNRLGNEVEAFAIYDTMAYVKAPVSTLAIGNAWGESAMLLAAGAPGLRGALPSASIMLRQPVQRFDQMQASDVDIYRRGLRKTGREVVRLLAKHTKHTEAQLERDIRRPRYFSPYEAVEYHIIDRVRVGSWVVGGGG